MASSSGHDAPARDPISAGAEPVGTETSDFALAWSLGTTHPVHPHEPLQHRGAQALLTAVSAAIWYLCLPVVGRTLSIPAAR